MLKVVDVGSEYFTANELNPKYIIIHCCGDQPQKALAIFAKHRVSAHFFLPDPNYIEEEEYPIYKLVDPEKQDAAWHAGQSHWKNHLALNGFSIGIEFNTANYANVLQGDMNLDYFSEFSAKQIDNGIELILMLMKKYSIPRENVIGHSDIACWRNDIGIGSIAKAKTDPGPLFPWENLAARGIGLWPVLQRTRSNDLVVSWEVFQRLAQDHGYAIDVTGKCDLKTQFVFQEFMRHYFPSECLGRQSNLPALTLNERIIIGLENLVDGHVIHGRCER